MTVPTSAPASLKLTHLRWGWWSLLVFASLGLGLETLHGLKIGWYLSRADEARRLMWTLAHAHGALLGLLHVAFAMTSPALTHERRARNASVALRGASVSLPLGFWLGGVATYGGDPGPGVALAPVGALAALLAIGLTASALGDGP